MTLCLLHRLARPIALLVVVTATCLGAAQAATLRLACSGLGREQQLCRSAAEAWGRKNGHTVELVNLPEDAGQRLQMLRRGFAETPQAIDVVQLDVVQLGALREHLLDLKPHTRGAERQHFSSMVANGTLDGKLLALPWFIDAGLLYYRRDLLEKYRQPVPQTWEQLQAVAQHIQTAERQAGNPRLWGYVWQGRNYEGLSCNALEWIASFGGGTLLDERGRVTVNQPKAVRALETAAGWIGRISPREVLDWGEEESRTAFQGGHAVFMRNWPYAWALTQAPGSALRGKVGIAVLPGGGGSGRQAATLGGQQLAVSRHAAEPALAAELVLHLTGAAVQKERALKASYNPTLNELYRDPEVRAANPDLGMLLQAFYSAVARPSTVTGAKYPEVSAEFARAVHEVLSGRAPAGGAMAALETRLRQILGSRDKATADGP
ncbi:ABC transporter substrate-binding protein [Aquabacterium sp. A7-Y]|uniref:ABC transporter substrate-binding protein n=1 Tax=Aquabacterium sp. A7-Y TaxID=1349605 RepID=UPI00223D9EB6|nr:ABC transporter substrate-binding protein [Aquabacterium sp. A7-Y]MCW7540582.1 ABC transporter substrate-binding protein [Aquabacterium sp. A7-Y]